MSPLLLYTDRETVIEKLSNLTELTQLVSNRDDLNPELLPEFMLMPHARHNTASLQSVQPLINPINRAYARSPQNGAQDFCTFPIHSPVSVL